MHNHAKIVVVFSAPLIIVFNWFFNSSCHPKDITRVAFHRSYPLFASSSDDCTAYVFHGMVYSDLNQNPLIVPLEILRGHASVNGRGNFLIHIFYTLWNVDGKGRNDGIDMNFLLGLSLLA